LPQDLETQLDNLKAELLTSNKALMAMTVSFQGKEIELQQSKEEVARLEVLDSVQRTQELEASLNTLTVEMDTLQQQKDQVSWVTVQGCCCWVTVKGCCTRVAVQGCCCWVTV
jgi:hypothetical protein